MSTNIPANLKYTKEHEWALYQDGVVTVGITDFAQSSLGDIVFVELPEVGTTLTQDQSFGVVESIKSVSDLYSPLAGEVVEVNNDATDSPESLNSGPYDVWLIKIKVDSEDQFNGLLDNNAYSELCQ